MYSPVGGYLIDPSVSTQRAELEFLVTLDPMRKLFRKFPLSLLVVICLTLGLAPFTPEPHLLEKLKMLTAGELVKPLDIFDFALHGLPWVLLVIKLYLLTMKTQGAVSIEDK